MKRLSIILSYLLIIIGVSCAPGDGDADPKKKSPEELAVEKLAGTSGISYSINNGGSIRRNSFDESVFYPNFSLRFNASGKTYTSSNGDVLFEPSGTWEFVGANFDKIKLSGNKLASGIEISYTKTNNDLIIKFSVNNPPNGRIEALVGSYEIKLVGN
jgi:hypothetical protein